MRRFLLIVPLAAVLACGGDDGGAMQTDTGTSGDGDGDGDGDGEPTIPADAAWVSVDLDAPIAQVDPRFLSYALDTDKVVYQGFDFARPRLLELTTQLSPALLRIGGTKADLVYYDLSDTPIAEPPAGYDKVMDRATWDAACNFAAQLGVEIMFTINAGPGPRGQNGEWISDQARELIEYSVAQGCPVSVWEFGNEVGAFGYEHGFQLSAEDYAADFASFDSLLDELDPTARNAGPASMYLPVEGEIFVKIIPGMLAEVGGLLDILTWHYYPQQSHNCPVGTRVIDQPIPPLFWLDAVDTWAAEVEGYRDQGAPQAEVWLGESGHAQCGGEAGISDTFASSFWWLDQLGRVAARGQPITVRQALSGGFYNLIVDLGLEPKPDYYASVLWKRHMGAQVLEVGLESAPETLHAYAHCDVEGGGAIAVLLINYDDQRSIPVALLDGSVGFEAMVVTAQELTATSVSVNGQPWAAAPDGSVPSPAVELTHGALELPPLSYAFVRLPEAGAPACE